MKTVRLVGLLALFLIASCTTPARVTTEAERQVAGSALNAAQAVLIVATPKMRPEQVALANQQIAALRQRIDASASTPLDWSTLLLDIAAAAAQWEALKGAK